MMKLKEQGRDSVVCEDGAGNHKRNNEIWLKWGLKKFLDWPAKSPDLNPIEKAWRWCRNWLRRKNLVFHNRQEAEYWWQQA